VAAEGADPLLSPHGQVYLDSGEVNIDPSNNSRYTRAFTLNWGTVAGVVDTFAVIKEIMYFYLLFPMIFLRQSIVVHTSNTLVSKGKRATTLGEMLKFFGITLSMSLEPCRGGVEAYWDDGLNLDGTIYQKRDYKNRFGMSRHRFQDLRSCLSLGPIPANLVYIIIFLLYKLFLS
jgi:hypothetical protein